MEFNKPKILIHDLKDQVNGISFCINILKEELDQGKGADTIVQMRESCQKLIRILDNMSKLEK